MTTHLLSADHRLPGLDVVARLGAVAPGLGPDLMEAVPDLRGVVVLSTCNRLSLLVETRRADDSEGSGRLPRVVSAFLARRAGIDPSALHMSCLDGSAARRKIFAIAAGLESMVVGEPQIAGQVRRATATASKEGTLSPCLVRVLERASAISRRVARETGLVRSGRSIVAVGVEQAAEHLPPVSQCRAVIVGTGSYAGATVAALRERGLRDIVVYSVSNRAEAFASSHGLQAVAAERLADALAAADLVVTCRGLGSPALTADLVAPLVQECHCLQRPLVVLDLALTRDVDPAVASLPGIIHIDLARVRDAVPAAEVEQVEAARAIVETEADDFERRLGGRGMGPVITSLRSRVDQVVAEEVARLRPLQFEAAAGQPAGRAGDDAATRDTAAGTEAKAVSGTDEVSSVSALAGDLVVTVAQAEQALHHLAARLLHRPTVMARRAGQDGYEEAYRDALELVLGLEPVGSTHV